MSGLKKILQLFQRFIFGSVRGQLIVGVALLNSVLMTLFVWYLLGKQHSQLLDRQIEHSKSLTAGIATSSSVWLAARDYSGMQEIIESQRSYPDLEYAMILDTDGLVLAHTQKEFLGKYVQDIPRDEDGMGARVSVLTGGFVDTVRPVVMANQKIGWVRVGLGQGSIQGILGTITRAGIFQAIGITLIGSLFVFLLGWRLTRRLYVIQGVADAIQSGSRDTRVDLKGTDEAARLGLVINAMLNTLVLRESELEKHRDHLSELVAGRTREIAEQQIFMEAVLDNIADGIVACDEKGTLSYFNKATRMMHGIEQADLPPEQWSDYYRLYEEDGKTSMPTDNIPLFRAFSGLEVRDQPLIIEHANGMRRFMLCNGQAMYDETGAKLGAVVSMHDVTLQKKYEAELINARDAAQAANRAKSIFLANMNHELRTPLNAILGFSLLMSRDPGLRNDQKENLDIINRSGEHLLALINDVLEVARIEAGKLKLDISPFDLGEMIREIIEMMQIRSMEKGLKLQFEQSSEFPRYIKGDVFRLRQILINLLGNAIKFSETGTVTLRLGTKDDNENCLWIEVEDTGSGISHEDQERLFEPFEQLGGAAKRFGTGLGLAITRQFVNLMKGRITVKSEPGRGSVFRVEIPVERVSEKDLFRSVIAISGEVAGLAPGQKPVRALIVEDQYENRLLLSRLMSDIGVETRTANDGRQGVQLFSEWKPDIVWMDRKMPVMDGAEAAKNIRKLPGGKDTKIIAVTASVFKEEMGEIIEAGMDDMIRKPFRAHEIYDCMAKYLGVKFIYKEADVPKQISAVLSQHMLNSIPGDLLDELENGLIRLDTEKIRQAIKKIGDINPDIARTLTLLADNFEYPTILEKMGRQ